MGDLTPWVKQGVFLLNTALTVQEGEPESHLELWKSFSKELIKYITSNYKSIIFLLWGKKAQNYKQYINNSHHVICCSHPSPLSSSSTNPFTGSKCFTKANKILLSMSKNEIDWSI